MLGPIAVLALDPAALWPGDPALRASFPFGSTISPDDRTLTVQLPAADSTACPGEPIYAYDVVFDESSTAVQVGLTRRRTGIAKGDRTQMCTDDLMLKYAPYTVKLSAPLGNRVTIERDGTPIPINRQA